jgi:hypothetical protein
MKRTIYIFGMACRVWAGKLEIIEELASTKSWKALTSKPPLSSSNPISRSTRKCRRRSYDADSFVAWLIGWLIHPRRFGVHSGSSARIWKYGVPNRSYAVRDYDDVNERDTLI